MGDEVDYFSHIEFGRYRNKKDRKNTLPICIGSFIDIDTTYRAGIEKEGWQDFMFTNNSYEKRKYKRKDKDGYIEKKFYKKKQHFSKKEREDKEPLLLRKEFIKEKSLLKDEKGKETDFYKKKRRFSSDEGDYGEIVYKTPDMKKKSKIIYENKVNGKHEENIKIWEDIKRRKGE